MQDFANQKTLAPERHQPLQVEVRMREKTAPPANSLEISAPGELTRDAPPLPIGQSR